MADTLALGASAARHGGSSPLPRTNKLTKSQFFVVREAVSGRDCVRT